MKIYFIRHGHPDYSKDCLTTLGCKQAAAAAERLKDCEIEKIYSSTRGRAFETAQFTANVLGMDVIPSPFMKEINWTSINKEPILEGGHPWNISDVFAAEGKSLLGRDWQEREPYCKTHVVNSYKIVVEGLDAWLLDLGYRREGEYYRVVGDNTDRTVAMFSHGGSSSVALSHIFNIPLPQLCGFLHPEFTSITIVEFSNKTGELFCPRFALMNDARHIYGIEGEKLYGN
jgi:probable phosphoglycerate mutase